MPSIDASDALTKSSKNWSDYCQEREQERINLKLFKTSKKILDYRDYKLCDLSGADLSNKKLDHSTFSQTNLTDVIFIGSSLFEVNFNVVKIISCEFENVHFKGAKFNDCKLINLEDSGIVFESVEFKDCDLSNLNFKDVTFINVKFSNCKLENISVDARDFSKVKFCDCVIKDVRIETKQELIPEFFDCNISQLNVISSKISKGAFINSTLQKLSILCEDVQELDFCDSRLINVNVKDIGPRSAHLLNSAFIKCEWPNQVGEVDLYGKYNPSKNLLSHPVQDIMGLPPKLRRDIADSQFLVDTINSSSGLFRKFFIRLWGASSSYGQSSIRLVLFSFLILILHALLITLSEFSLASEDSLVSITNISSLTAGFIGAFENVTLVFFSLATEASNSIYNSVKIFSYIMLGVWASVCASKLIKLSSD